jgi:hypothetical protein
MSRLFSGDAGAVARVSCPEKGRTVKSTIVSVLVIGTILLPAAHGQRGGGGMGRGGVSGGWMGGGHGGGFRSPGFFGLSRGFNRFGNGYNQNGFGGYGFGDAGYFDSDFGGYADQGPMQAAPPAVVVVPMMPPPPPPPPPPPIRSSIQEYSWPAANRSSAATFAIATKDGTVRYASSVWSQDGSLMFVSPEGQSGKLDLASIDVPATGRLNSERGLTLQIPPR